MYEVGRQANGKKFKKKVSFSLKNQAIVKKLVKLMLRNFRLKNNVKMFLE